MKNKLVTGLGKRLKKTRSVLGIKQKEMAEIAGVHSPYLSAIENGKRANPGIAFLFYISRHYHVSLDYLVHGIGDMFLPSTENDEKRDPGLSPVFETIEDVTGLMKISNFAKNSILSYVVRFYIENEDFINMEKRRAKGNGQEK